ncbi:hypothetical protein SDC9_182840 [bioreactor metagenome]|uniref:Uncharacterized protein n=1 Tax=bioreactor metagenome TaxID=1076179 RepID=A0A645HAE9_9ZZZZ
MGAQRHLGHALPRSREVLALARDQLHTGLQIVGLVSRGSQVEGKVFKALQRLQSYIELLQPVQLLADGLHAITDLAVAAHHAGGGILCASCSTLVSGHQREHRFTDLLHLLAQALLRLLGILSSDAKALQFTLGLRQGLLLQVEGGARTICCCIKLPKRGCFFFCGRAKRRDLTTVVSGLGLCLAQAGSR